MAGSRCTTTARLLPTVTVALKLIVVLKIKGLGFACGARENEITRVRFCFITAIAYRLTGDD